MPQPTTTAPQWPWSPSLGVPQPSLQQLRRAMCVPSAWRRCPPDPPAARMSPSGSLSHTHGVAAPGHVCDSLLNVPIMLQTQSRKGLALLNVETETPGSGETWLGLPEAMLIFRAVSGSLRTQHIVQELLLLDTSRGLSLPVLGQSISREQHRSLLTPCILQEQGFT